MWYYTIELNDVFPVPFYMYVCMYIYIYIMLTLGGLVGSFEQQWKAESMSRQKDS